MIWVRRVSAVIIILAVLLTAVSTDLGSRITDLLIAEVTPPPTGSLLRTFTATPIGSATATTYEVTASDAMRVPMNHLAVVRLRSGAWICCTINRTKVNSTPGSMVHEAQDSGFAAAQAAEARAQWEDEAD